ncbi:DNA repair protein RadC [Formivibrio citricus]|uniref:DNA repair protein RadC n=1 Tax=Formivibrio citricus TaxID=83765 RepID=A0A1I4VKP1_9NEIS|nr:JAB domain-containing protein [Formivibrio citricus]SFN01761.1 DNA repair protein RadC [Formivibrio citricus]
MANVSTHPAGSRRRVYPFRFKTEEELISAALSVLETRTTYGPAITSPDSACQLLKLKLGELKYEVFGVIWLDAGHQIIAVEDMFRGTLDEARIYPRQVARRALEIDAAAVIIYHNHPSGRVGASDGDRQITEQIKQTLSLIDVKLLDHLIIGGAKLLSFKENGYL